MTIDTDDSSGLAAADTAVRSLRQGSCDRAFASSASWITSPHELVPLCASGLLSKSGRTRVFDESMDGFTRGEGAVTAVLRAKSGKTGQEMLEDDYTKALIVGTGLTSSTKATAMQEVMEQAAADAQVPFWAVDAIETSASGVRLTDGLEIASLSKVLEHKNGWPVTVSSSKANFGHLAATSGLLGFAKSVYFLEHGVHGPQIHLRQLLKLEEDENCRLQFLTEATQSRDVKQMIGVSSFGTSGSICHQLLVGEKSWRCSWETAGKKTTQHSRTPQREVEWFPNTSKQKDVGLPVYRGYFLMGTMTAWQDGLLMEEESPGIFGYTLKLSENFERFQIWIDEDSNRVLHPSQPDGQAESKVDGPSAEKERSFAWRLGDGKAGDAFRVRLHLNGKFRRLEWTKLKGLDVMKPLDQKDFVHKFFIIGDHSHWFFKEMNEVKKGNFVAEVQLLKEKSGFQIYRDADFDMGFYPAEARNDLEILGPDGFCHGCNWEITGKVGDVFQVHFQRQAGRGQDKKSLRWEYLRNEAVDWVEKTKHHVPFVFGSWSDFKDCEALERTNATGNWKGKFRLGESGQDKFQILINRNPLASLHPNSDVATSDGRDLQGPDDAGHGKYWILGTEKDGLRAGDEVNIHLDMNGPLPVRVWWERVESFGSHHEYLRQGSMRTLKRHERLMGIYNITGDTPVQVNPVIKVQTASEWADGRRAQQAIVWNGFLDSWNDRYPFLENSGTKLRMGNTN